MRCRHLLCILIAALPCSVVTAQENYSARVADLVKAGDIAGAFSEAQRWVAVAADSPEALTTCGDLAVRCGAFAQAADSYEAALFIGRTPALAVKLGDALLEDGRPDAALRSYRGALDMDEREAAAHAGIGRVYMDDPNRLFEARVSLQTALAIDPDNPQALLGMAQLDLTDSRGEQGWAALVDLIRKFPDLAAAQLLAGTTEARWEQPAAAREYWRKYVQLEPARPEAWLLAHNLFPIQQQDIAMRGNYHAYSPDGKKIACCLSLSQTKAQINVAPADNLANVTKLCDLDEMGSGLAWSPDGSRTAIRSFKKVTEGGKDRWDYSLWTVSSSGGDLRRIHVGQYIGQNAWTPDGKRLIFDAVIPQKGRGIQVADDRPDAPLETLIPPVQGQLPLGVTMNRVGDTLLVQSASYSPSTSYNLLVYRMSDLAHPRTLYSGAANAAYPVFSADDNDVIYLELDANRRYSLYALPLEGDGQPRAMQRGTIYYPAPLSLAPDGKHLLVYAQSGPAMLSLDGLR